VSDDALNEDGIPTAERDALLSIAHGAVVTSGGVSIQRALSLGLEAILTRGLGPGVYGVYAFGWRIMTMCLRFADLGTNWTLLRDIPAFDGEPTRQRRSLGLSYATTALTACAIAAIMIVAADWINAVTLDHPALPPVLGLFALLLVFTAFVRIHATSLRATKSVNGEVLLWKVLYPGIRLIGAAVAIGVGYSIVGVVGVLIVSVGSLAVFAYPPTVATTGLRPTFRGFRSEIRHFYDHALPSALDSVGGLLRSRIDVLLIGIFLTATAAGIYNVVLVLVAIAGIPLKAFNQLMPPVASDLYSNNEIQTLNEVYTTITRLIVTATVPLIAILIVFGPELLGLFGAAFRRGYPVLLVFLGGRFVRNAVGATGILMSMTNNHYPKMVLEWFLAVLNVVLTYLFVVEFGLIGAALGTSLAVGLQNFLQAILLLRFEGLWPFDTTFLKPLVAGTVMVGVMVGIRTAVDGSLAAGLAAVAGLVVFITASILFGIDGADRFVVRELVVTYRSVLTN